MAYSPIDLSRMGRFQAPKVDFIGNALMGQKMNTQQQALSGLSDPMQRFNLLFNNKTPIDPNAPTGKTESVFLQRQKVLDNPEIEQMVDEYYELANQVSEKRKLNPNDPASSEMMKMNAIAQKYKTKTQQTLSEQTAIKGIDDIYKQRRMIRGEKEYDISMDQRKKEFAHKLSEDQNKKIEERIGRWTKNAGLTLLKIGIINSISTFIQDAIDGNPIARKNLLASSSRLGSNEALSDTEFSILKSGNILDLISGLGTQLFGDGSKISNEDVRNAIQVIGSHKNKYIPAYNRLVDDGATDIAREFNVDKNDVISRMTLGVDVPTVNTSSTTTQASVAPVNDVKSRLTPQKKQATTTKAPRKATLADF